MTLRSYWLGVLMQNIALLVLLWVSISNFRPLILDDAKTWGYGSLYLDELHQQLHLISKKRTAVYALSFFSWLLFRWFWRLNFYRSLNRSIETQSLRLHSYVLVSAFRWLRVIAMLSSGALVLQAAHTPLEASFTSDWLLSNWLLISWLLLGLLFYWASEIICELTLLNGGRSGLTRTIELIRNGSLLSSGLIISLRAAVLTLVLSAQLKVLTSLAHLPQAALLDPGKLSLSMSFYIALALTLLTPALKEAVRALSSFELFRLSFLGSDDKEAGSAG